MKGIDTTLSTCLKSIETVGKGNARKLDNKYMMRFMGVNLTPFLMKYAEMKLQKL